MVVCGGAGFLGSAIVVALVGDGHDVTVIDGLMPEAGGALANLDAVRNSIEFIGLDIANVTSLADVIRGSSVVVDCMGWTRHKAAFDHPAYDQQLNLASHVRLIETARHIPGARILYLGSRGEYGKPAASVITEDTPLVPTDVQSVHKVATDHLLRIYSALNELPVLSLRIPNSFGAGQPVEGRDVGLVGEWIRTAIAGGDIVLYGSGASTTHNPYNLPTMIAGGENMGLKHCGFWRDGDTRMSNVYLSILRSMGIEQESFSDSTGTIGNSIFSRV